MTTPTVVDDVWQRLHEEAVAAMRRAYAPYSHYPVGAAALVDDGRVVSGCNVENAGYGVTLCAECGLVSQLVNTGGGRLVAFACVNAHGEPAAPCGRCRQLLLEHGGRGLVLAMPSGVRTLDEVLPEGFGPEDLAEVARPTALVDDGAPAALVDDGTRAARVGDPAPAAPGATDATDDPEEDQ